MGKQKAIVADGGGKLPAKKQKLNGKENQELNKTAKKNKNVEEQQQNGKAAEAKVPAKKRKLELKKEEVKKEEEEEEKEEDKETVADKTTDAGNINKQIFGVFNKLKDIKQEHIKKHLKNMLTLLTSEATVNQSSATGAYSLKRLVRCTGADDMDAVALSGSYLCAIVSKVPGVDPIVLLDTLKRELPVGSQQRGKEESLAAVGQLITVLAIMKSEHFKQPSAALIAAIYPILVAHLKGREYVMNMCADIMADSFKQVNAESFESHVWPLLQLELNKPLSALKLHSCDLLLAVHLNYPKLLPLKQLESSLWRKQAEYAQLFELYMNSASIQGNGLYARLGRFLATTAGGKLLGDWQQHIVEQLPLKHNTAKGYVIQTLSFILLHFDDSKSSSDSPLEQLFASAPLMSMLLQELSTAKQLTEKSMVKAKPAQLQLRHICRRFEAALLLSFKRQLKQDSSKLAILQHLLELQLQLDSVVQTPRLTQQLLSQLGEQGLQGMYKFYSEQFTSNKEEFSKMHREHCLKYMQLLLHNPQLSELKKQIKFLLPISIFHLNEQQEPCNAAEAAAFSRQGAARCEEILFGCLLHKIGNSHEQLEALVAQLRDTLQQLAKLLAKPQIESKLRSQQTPELQQVWKQVQQVVNAAATKDNKQSLALVFDALILFLGLAMYAPSCNVSIELLNDLFICKQNALKKSKNKAGAELGWQDVLTDVLLQLLLQTGHFWRDFVNKIGGALMPQLGKENLEQLLVILDMNKNPLGDKEDGEGSEDEEEEEQQEEQSSDEEDEDEDEEEQEEDDDATNLEQIRENVRKALLDEDNELNDDASSVDWNDVDEAQGERLNLALERAFQAFKPKGQSNKSQVKQQTKSERINSTTLLHFRVRVLDLVELFVQAQPLLEVLLDALTSVYYVYQMSSNDNKLQPLAEASKKLLRKLLSQKITYKSPQEDKQPIVDCIKQFISQEEPSTDAKPQQQQQSLKKKGDLAEWRNKCVAFLVSQFNEQDVTKSAVWPLLQDYLQDWITRRNSPHTLASFDAIFVSQWTGVPQLAVTFASLLSKDLRNFRRNQILDLLAKHIGRIRIALANNKSAAQEFTSILTKYEPVGAKDRNQQTKLLNQLKKSNN
ncbi:myb-binding protein 1A [Drosophila innubila]|uniref:myb-binding protein 1A n=1 Tax=Drosophila innubila TaxID=198719 RepID=UPI00148D00A4|nr:myb-binding protein 1A [Drosophila innubila]